jgi:hypothetical protein
MVIVAQDGMATIPGQYDLEQSLIELKSQVDDLNKKYVEINEDLKYTNIDNYSNIFSHWLSIQQILIGLLGGLSLLLPLLTYLFGYKACQRC